MMQDATLKGLILCKFGSLANFAKSMNWSYGKAVRVANGSRDRLYVEEIRELITALELTDPDKIVSIFSLS